MQENYDKGRTSALLMEAQEITALLKAETEYLSRQMERVLQGGEEEPQDELEEAADDSNLKEGAVGRSFWQFWR